jgi:hypothetical protein
MPDIVIKIDLENEKGLSGALKRGLKNGLHEAGTTLLEDGEDFARDTVMGSGRVWNEQVKLGFERDVHQFNRYYRWKGYINNPVPHADVVDRGLAPAGEITGSNPSVQDIMPWVVDNLQPRSYGGGDGDNPFDGSGGGGDSPGAITDDDRTVQYGDLEDFGLREDAFESDFVKAGSLGDGTNVVWKSHLDEGHVDAQDWKLGIVRNEVVWSQAAEDRDWDLGPKSRLESATTSFGAEADGTLQEYVPGRQMKKVVHSGYGDVDEYDFTRPEFLAENREWAARTNAIDYIIGNADRHMNNVRITPDGEPRNIDSGGNQFNEDLKGSQLSLFGDLLEYGSGTDGMYAENQKMLDRTEEILDEIVADNEYRQSLINTVAEIHGEGSKEYDRIVKILGEDVGEGHILETDDRDIPIYKLHIQAMRDRHERINNGGDFYDREVDVVVLGPDDQDSTVEEDAILGSDQAEDLDLGIDKELNNMFGDDDKEE